MTGDLGLTTDGTVQPGLFGVLSTGVSTRPVMDAALRLVAALSAEQRKASTFGADDLEWRRWNNVHRAARAGISFEEMTEAQRGTAYALLQSGTQCERAREDPQRHAPQGDDRRSGQHPDPVRGYQASELNDAQRERLLDVIGEYVNNMAEGHAKIRMAEVRTHLADTHFGWVGETAADSVFYYRSTVR